MDRLTIILLVILFAVFPVFADDKSRQKGVPYFTNKDLERYKDPSDNKSPVVSDSADNISTFKSDSHDVNEEKKELKRYEIPYRAYEGTARRIIIPVKFNGQVTAPMLLDTGAPGMHISVNLAEKLNILNKDDSNLWIAVAGIGGSVPAIFTIIDTVEVGEASDSFIPTTISPSISRNFEGLIGMDFLANYSIHLDTRKKIVIFEELPLNPNMPAGHDEIWWRLTFHNFASMKSTWSKYRESLYNKEGNSKRLRQKRKFADKQYRDAQNLYNRLLGYAGTHAVPQEWRQ